MKRIFSLLMVVIMLSSAYAYAEDGKVLANYITVHEGPGSGYDKLCNAYNHNQLIVVGEVSGSDSKEWLMVDIQGSGLNSTKTLGYVDKAYVSTDGYLIKLARSLSLYTDPWSGKKNGYRQKGDMLFVIYEYGEWYVVQTNDDTSGVSFIKKKGAVLKEEVEPSSIYPSYEDNSGEFDEDLTVDASGYGTHWIVKSMTTSIYEELGSEPIYTLYRGDCAMMMRKNGEYGYFYFETPAKTSIYGWIRLDDLAFFS